MMSRILLHTCLIFVVLLGITGLAAAQSLAELNGVVVDHLGVAIPNATITVKGTDIGFQRTYAADEHGNYQAKLPAEGNYEVTAIALMSRQIKLLTLNNQKSVVLNFRIVTEACGDQPAEGAKLTNADRAEITRALLDFAFNSDSRSGNRIAEFILVPANVLPAWLTENQRRRVAIIDRNKIQKLTDRDGQLSYLEVRPLEQQGHCVAGTVWRHVTVKGQIENANMAGGGMIYEFFKVDGRWVGKWFAGWIS